MSPSSRGADVHLSVTEPILRNLGSVMDVCNSALGADTFYANYFQVQ